MRRVFYRGLIVVFVQVVFVSMAFSQPVYKQSFKFAKFLDYLYSYYVDTVNASDVVEEAIVNILDELDPHSTYIPADELKKMREPLQGNFEGIGISFNILKDTLYVISAISGGPSEKVGVRAGDKIVKVDGDNIAGIGITNEDVFSLLRGKKGTKVTITVLRKNNKELLDFTIVRDKIPIFSIDASYMINENTGYIKINRFSATTIKEFSEAAIALKEKNAQNLVLDLTGNGGGYLDAAVKLADEFLPANRLVVYTEGANSPKREYLTTSAGRFENGKIIVLIDEGSASASEIVSGAIQDWDRGIVLGRRSFGKGLVQREMLLPDESAVRITIARYYTPSGRLIQKPFINGSEEYHLEIYSRYSKGELASKDSIDFPDSLMHTTLVKERAVFGGGGIMPDIFIPFDTTYYSDYYRDLIRKGIINEFILEYVDNNRDKLLKAYPQFQAFKKGYTLSDKLFERFIIYAEKEGLVRDDEALEVSGAQIKLMLKAFMARDIYGRSEFFEIYNTSTETYLKALDVLRDWDTYYQEVFY
ncbi:MAG TPA: peptidase S41 [Bacteroidales bacterium]|jgi:carboxyl-terminal processing protease|nr:peptidase S41 [Bacteroidales bacterium]